MVPYTQFFTTPEGVRIAYATLGQGLPLVYVPPFLSHLELMWESPWFRSFNEALAEHFTLIRYDRYGCGLSDRDRTDFSLDVDVRVLAALVDHLRLRRVALLGISDGGPVAVHYAVAQPRRVSHLLLYSFQWQARDPTPTVALLFQLMRADWRVGVNALFDYLIPDADPDAREWLIRIHREACSPEVAVDLLSAGARHDLTDVLPQVRVPTLVMSRQSDQVFEQTRELAARIPGARFTTLPGAAHIPEFDQPDAIIRAIRDFTGHAALPPTGVPLDDGNVPAAFAHLSPREREVLRLIAAGLTNAEVADQLFISPHTVNTHLTNIYAKLGIPGRAAAIRLALEHDRR